MKKSSILLAILMMLSLALTCQNHQDTSKFTMHVFGKDTVYFSKERPSDKAIKKGDYLEAITLLRQGLSKDSCDAGDNYNLACMYSKTGKPDSACYFLNISQQLAPGVLFLMDPDFYPLIHTPAWKRLESNYLNYIKKYGMGVKKIDLALELWKMQQTDQLYYKELHLAESKWGPKSRQVDSIWALKKPINDQNVKRLEEIVSLNGWPKISDVGKKAAGSSFLIIQHADFEKQKKYEPLMEEAANKGEASWRELALLIDRLLVKENKPQIYGSQLRFNDETKSYEPCPIEDEHNLDLRRKKVGLNAAADYYKNWNILYTVVQNKE